jgi:endonuclease-3
MRHSVVKADLDDSLTTKYKTIYRKLAQTYGEPVWKQHRPPVDELVCTILSQATSDVNRDKGFSALVARYPDWEQVMKAPEADVIDTIRPAGLANQKGPRIQAALRTIYEAQGEIELDFLAGLPLQEATQWLTRIQGVGPKTAAIVLLFAFGRPAFPVDTHVHRITRRVGLIGPKVTADKAHNILHNIGSPETFYPIHLNLIRHGREICQARNPKCEHCSIQSCCDYYQAEMRDLRC